MNPVTGVGAGTAPAGAGIPEGAASAPPVTATGVGSGPVAVGVPSAAASVLGVIASNVSTVKVHLIEFDLEREKPLDFETAFDLEVMFETEEEKSIEFEL
jgi:hypothetical protein